MVNYTRDTLDSFQLLIYENIIIVSYPSGQLFMKIY